MEIKYLTRQFGYRILPKPEGGFVARSTDPAVPPLEAPTRGELQQKIRANMAAALAEAFPGMKFPLPGQTKFEVHIERKPHSGFDTHSEEQGPPQLETATQERIHHFAEELLGFMDKNLSDLSQLLVAQARSKDQRSWRTRIQPSPKRLATPRFFRTAR
jgi:hypothetical protein